MYICMKNGKTFRVKGEKAAKIYKAAGYTVTEETATVKKATKSKSKAAEPTETTD